jgi:hypothetical protein
VVAVSKVVDSDARLVKVRILFGIREISEPFLDGLGGGHRKGAEKLLRPFGISHNQRAVFRIVTDMIQHRLRFIPIHTCHIHS